MGLIENTRDAPLFTELIASQINIETVPTLDEFKGSNLQEAMGKTVKSLNQKEYEKYILYFFGYSRPKEFAAMNVFSVNLDGKAFDKINSSVNITETILNQVSQNNKVGIRLYPQGDRQAADSPFAFIGSIENPLLLWDENHQVIIGIIDRGKNKEYKFSSGDEIDVFPQPRSEKAIMKDHQSNTKADRDLKEAHKIALGGGFVFQLHDIDLGNHELIFTTQIVLDDREPRNINTPIDPKTSKRLDKRRLKDEEYGFLEGDEVFQVDMNLRVKITHTDNKLTAALVPDQPELSLDQAIKDQNVRHFLQCVFDHLIKEDGDAILKLFSIVTTLHPEMDTHSIKGFFTTRPDDQGSLNITTMIFDFESREVREQWTEYLSTTPFYYLPGNNPDAVLQLVIDRLPYLEDPNISHQYVQAMLKILGLLYPTANPIQLKDMLIASGAYYDRKITDLLEDQILQMKVDSVDSIFCSPYLKHHPDIIDSISQHLSDNPSRTPTHLFTPHAALAKYLRNILPGNNNWHTIENTEGVYELIMDHSRQFLIVSIHGFEIAYWIINNNQMVNLTQMAIKDNPKSFPQLKPNEQYHWLGRQVIMALKNQINSALNIKPENYVPGQLPQHEGDGHNTG